MPPTTKTTTDTNRDHLQITNPQHSRGAWKVGIKKRVNAYGIYREILDADGNLVALVPHDRDAKAVAAVPDLVLGAKRAARELTTLYESPHIDNTAVYSALDSVVSSVERAREQCPQPREWLKKEGKF